jgi:hypothetical protein
MQAQLIDSNQNSQNLIILKLSQVKYHEKTGQPIIDNEQTITADPELIAALQKSQQIFLKSQSMTDKQQGQNSSCQVRH